MKASLLQTIFVACLGLTTVGCVTSHGPLYESVQKSKDLAVADGKSLLLIYWHDPMGGVKLYLNDQKIATIGPGENGFVSYQAEPGPLRISSGVASGNITRDVFAYGVLVTASGQKKDRVMIDAVAGRPYYVRMQKGFWHEQMQLVSAEDAKKEIADCHWQNPPAPQK